MTRGANRTTPRIVGGCVRAYSAFGYEQWLIEAHPESWKRFLQVNKSFYYDGNILGYTARKEMRRGGEFWYAYKRVDGKLYNLYIGHTQDVTQDHLWKVSQELRNKIENTP